MQEISWPQISGNLIERIAKQWFLITAGSMESCNTMTANWGGVGFLWMKPVVYVWIRPERHTFGFVEKHGDFTLAFLPGNCREALNLCGRVSGRDCDKIKEAGLTKVATPAGNVTFAEAELTLECRKLYSRDLDPAGFLDQAPLTQWYGESGGLHRLYIAEILHAYQA